MNTREGQLSDPGVLSRHTRLAFHWLCVRGPARGGPLKEGNPSLGFQIARRRGSVVAMLGWGPQYTWKGGVELFTRGPTDSLRAVNSGASLGFDCPTVGVAVGSVHGVHVSCGVSACLLIINFST